MVPDKRSDTIVRRKVPFNAEPPSSVLAGGGEIPLDAVETEPRQLSVNRPRMGRHWRHTTGIPSASSEFAGIRKQPPGPTSHCRLHTDRREGK
jgi:hypothetical protein